MSNQLLAIPVLSASSSSHKHVTSVCKRPRLISWEQSIFMHIIQDYLVLRAEAHIAKKTRMIRRSICKSSGHWLVKTITLIRDRHSRGVIAQITPINKLSKKGRMKKWVDNDGPNWPSEESTSDRWVLITRDEYIRFDFRYYMNVCVWLTWLFWPELTGTQDRARKMESTKDLRNQIKQMSLPFLRFKTQDDKQTSYKSFVHQWMMS